MGMEFDIMECKTRAAYSAKPAKEIKLDLDKVKEKFKVLIETPMLLVIEEEGVEVIVRANGELILKKVEDKDKMKRIAERVYEVGE